MKRILWMIPVFAMLLSACAPATEIAAPAVSQPTVTQAEPTLPPAPPPSATETGVPADDLFTLNNISLPSPVCDGNPMPAQTEGPYYKAGSPERNSLLEPGMQGTRLLLVGYVLDPNCQPLPNIWLDFWQANANGEYDNTGFTLRGHQYTDEQGRYFLETVLPGLYTSRPIEHIHVKLLTPSGAPFVTQLYFPNQPIPGLTVTLEERGDFLIGMYNFILP